MYVKIIKQILQARLKLFILIFLLLLANTGLYFFVTAVQAPRLTRLQNTWFEMRRAREKGTFVDAASVYKQGTVDLATWRNLVSPKKDFPRVIGELLEISANNSLSVRNISYKPTLNKEQNILTYTISFDVVGKYAGIKSFLADVMRSREMMTIDTISLNSGRATEESVDLKVQLTAYFRTEG